MRMSLSKGWLMLPLSMVLVSVSACQKQPSYGYIHGQTMGTSYHIRFELPETVNGETIQQSVDERLAQINQSMSTYQDDTTISKFNRLSANTPIKIDKDFIQVMKDSEQVYQATNGAFDPTVLPLVELWGFGGKLTVDRLQNPPSPAQIQQADELIDFPAIHLEGDELQKTKDGVSLDFSAIAKGYAVDAIADVLHSQYHINNYMVEIGGEVATAGVNDKNAAWQIAIDAPILDSSVSQRQTMTVIRQPLDAQKQGSMHLATSGNYRNSMVFDGVRYSHTIDTHTGRPVIGGVPSVTVAAQSVAIADAWATALTAVPYEQALDMAKQQDIAALFIVHANPDDTSKPTHNYSDWKIVETPKMQALRANKTS